jgi:single-stranded DNA-binding protein
MTGSATLMLLGTVAEVEHLQTKNGRPWIKLLIEVKSWRRAQDGEPGQEESTLLSVNCFAKLAETARDYLKAGDAVGITARVSGTEFSGGDGKVKRGISLTADQLHLIPNSRSAAPRSGPTPVQQKEFGHGFKPAPRQVVTNQYGEPGDIPF